MLRNVNRRHAPVGAEPITVSKLVGAQPRTPIHLTAKAYSPLGAF